MTKANTYILKQLETKERFEQRILHEHSEKLYKMFQIIYETDAKVRWERIFRYSTESNFVNITAVASLSEGTELSDGTVIQDAVDIEVNWSLPLRMLGDNTSAYELADHVKTLDALKEVLDHTEYHHLMRNHEFDMETIMEYIPSVANIPDEAVKDETYLEYKMPSELQGFDLDGLSEAQKESLTLNGGTKQ